MYSKITKFVIKFLTMLIYIFIDFFIYFIIQSKYIAALYFLLFAIISSVASFLLVFFSKQTLEKFSITSIRKKSYIKEDVVWFLFLTLFPFLFINKNFFILIVITTNITYLVLTYTENTYFNPILYLFKYKFYKIKIDYYFTYTIITRKKFSQLENLKSFIVLFDFVLIDAE